MRSLRPELAEYLQHLLKHEYASFLNAKPEPTAIRINTLKTDLETFTKKLHRWQVPYKPHPANPVGLILENDHLPLSHTLPFFTGEFNYQGIASQLPALVLDPQPGETILDMAASPGSKSTQIAALMKNQGRLVLNEVSLYRHQALVVNTRRAGVINNVITHLPGQRMGNMLPEFFDRVLVDAPCSALGTLPEHFDEINQWWSLQTLKKLTYIQHHLLVSAIKAVKVNGLIVYSTCTIAPEENEQLIDSIIKEYPVEIEEIQSLHGIHVQPGMTHYKEHTFKPDLKKAVRTYPHRDSVEGFFIVRLRKIAPMKINEYKRIKVFHRLATADDAEISEFLHAFCSQWGIDPDYLAQFHYRMGKKRVWLVSPDWKEMPEVEIVNSGLLLAEKKGRGWKLSNASAQFLNKRITRSLLELSEAQLKELFKTGSLNVSGIPTGYHVLNFHGEHIGCVSVVRGLMKIRLPHFFNLVLIS